VAYRDIRVEGHYTVRDSLHLRILAAAGTAAVVLDPGQVAGTEAGNTPVADVVGAAGMVVQGEDREKGRGEDEGFLVLLRGVLRDVVGVNQKSQAIRLCLLSIYPGVQSLGQCWDPRHPAICDNTVLFFDPGPARQLSSNYCHRALVPQPSV
jgi:hypothetical protein